MADFTRFGLAVERWRAHRVPELDVAPASGPVIGYTEMGAELCWPSSQVPGENGHAVLFGSSGAGKTILAAAAFVREFVSRSNDEQALAACLVDPKGDMTASVLDCLCATAPALLERTHVLDPFARKAVGFEFNLSRLAVGDTPVDVRAAALAQLCATLSTSTGGQQHLQPGARQIDVLTNTLLAALTVDHPRAHLLLALDSLTQPGGLKALGAITTSERAKQFLLSAELGDELRASCAARLRSAFASTAALEALVTTRAMLRFDQLLAPGQLTIVDLGRPFGGLLFLQKFLASLVLRLVLDHLLERPSPWSGHRVALVLDEAHLLAGTLADVAELILTTGRSRGVALTCITQGTAILNEEAPTLLRVLLGNAPVVFTGRLASQDAEVLARGAAPPPGVEESFSATRQRLAASIANLPDRHFFSITAGRRTRFVSAPIDLTRWREAREREQDAVQRTLVRHQVPLPTERRLLLSDLTPRTKGAGRNSKWAAKQRPSVGAAAESVRHGPSAEHPEPRPPTPRSRWG